jgi:hypothetical protein
MGYWINARTLLVVTTESGNPAWPDTWQGRAEMLDRSTGIRTLASGLTRMLNRFHASPDGCKPSPDGKWLLWSVATAPDHYPETIVSNIDGSRHYPWESGKFDGKYWLNDHVWLVTDHKTFYSVPRIHLYDTNDPLKPRETRVDAPLAGSLITQQSVEKELFDEVDNGTNNFVPFKLGKYRAADYYLNYSDYSTRKNAHPIQTYAIPMPEGADVDDVEVSPDNQWVLYAVAYERIPPLLKLLHRFLPSIAMKPILVKSLWISRTDGDDMHEIGYIEFKDRESLDNNRNWYQLHWLSDSKHIGFIHERSVYTIAVD